MGRGRRQGKRLEKDRFKNIAVIQITTMVCNKI